MTHDYSDFDTSDEPTPEDLLQKLSRAATDQLRMEAAVERLGDELKEAKEKLRIICEITIPELMEKANMADFSTGDGLSIKISEKIRGLIPKANEPEAFEYLNENGHGNLIKRQFSILFGKGDERWAAKFQQDLERRKKPVNCARKDTVHVQTLQAWVREQLQNGVAIPMATFGVYRQRFSNVRMSTK